MSSMNDLIKRVTKGYLESLKLADVQYGTVTRTNPLEVTVEQRLALTEDFLVVPEHMTSYTIPLGDQQVIIRRGLETDDKVVLVRENGGLNYVIVGRLMT